MPNNVNCQSSPTAHIAHPTRYVPPSGSAVGAHVEALRRLLEGKSLLRPQANTFLASFFYEDARGMVYVFTQTIVSGRKRFSRWRVHNGDLRPFNMSNRDLPDLIHHLRTKLAFSNDEIADILNIESSRVLQLSKKVN